MARCSKNDSQIQDVDSRSLCGDDLQKYPWTTTIPVQTPLNGTRPDGDLHSHPWWPSLYRIRPLSGIAALVVSIICILASLGILLGSRGKPVDSWYFKPTVLLAIATAVSNTALNCALAQAAPISFLYKAYRGSTIRDLELEWEAGTMFPRAMIRGFRQGRHFNLLTLSSLVVALVVVDGPLLQRASSVYSTTMTLPIVQNITIAQELPRGFSGTWYINSALKVSSSTTHVGKSFAEGKTMRSADSCDGSCAMKVLAPGVIKSQCNTIRWPISESMLQDPSASWGSQYDGTTSSKPLMFVGFFFFSEGMPMANDVGPERVVLTIGRTELRGFEGSYIETNCTIQSAVLEYDIALQGYDITFTAPPTSSMKVRDADTWIDSTQDDGDPQPLTWTGLASYLSVYSSANASFVTDLATGVTTYPSGPTLNGLVMRHTEQIGDDSEGTLIVSDPTNEVLNSLNELMFRAGIMAGSEQYRSKNVITSEPSVKQSVKARQTLSVDVFDASLGWFAGAATIQVVAILLVLPVLWGWWELGLVDLTLSPFHVATLFDAPLLQHVHSTVGAVGIMRDVGDMQIKLGLVDTTTPACANCFPNEYDLSPRNSACRLGVAEAHRVTRPQKGMRFTQ